MTSVKNPFSYQCSVTLLSSCLDFKRNNASREWDSTGIREGMVRVNLKMLKSQTGKGKEFKVNIVSACSVLFEYRTG